MGIRFSEFLSPCTQHIKQQTVTWGPPLWGQQMLGGGLEEGGMKLGSADILQIKTTAFLPGFLLGFRKAQREELITPVTLNFLRIARGKGVFFNLFLVPCQRKRARDQGAGLPEHHLCRHSAGAGRTAVAWAPSPQHRQKTEVREVTHLAPGPRANWRRRWKWRLGYFTPGLAGIILLSCINFNL